LAVLLSTSLFANNQIIRPVSWHSEPTFSEPILTRPTGKTISVWGSSQNIGFKSTRCFKQSSYAACFAIVRTRDAELQQTASPLHGLKRFQLLNDGYPKMQKMHLKYKRAAYTRNGWKYKSAVK
jgi:hypothetical protein